MASEGASGEQPPPPAQQALTAAVLGGVDAKCDFNMDNLSKPELLTLLSIMEGELEARDLVIEALRAQRREVFLQERYSHYSLTDPFLALQRDFECGVSLGDKERRPLGSSPMSVLEAVMAHCRKMQERMSAQLAAAESHQKRLEMEKLQLQSLEQDHRKLTAQLKDEREKNKHIVMMLVRECKQLATRVVEESQRFDELQARLDEEGRAAGRLREELGAERLRGQQMEAEMEKQLSELDTEREQLRARLGREEVESQNLRQQVEELRTECGEAKDGAQPATPACTQPKASVSMGTDPISSRTASCQTDHPLPEIEGPKKAPLTVAAKPTPGPYAGLSLPKTTVRGIVHGSSGGLAQSENGSEAQAAPPGLPSGVSPRVQAARYKFQEQDQNGTASQSPPARDPSPTNRENFAKQQARHTVTQVLSRFTSPPAGGTGVLRPGLPHSASEGGPFPSRLSHPIGLKSPTVARIDRGNPPPIPPKKPGLSQTPSAPHPPMKVVGDSARSHGAGLKSATPQLPPKPALDLVPALTASQVGACPLRCSQVAERPPVVITAIPSINPLPPSLSISTPSNCSPPPPTDSPLATASALLVSSSLSWFNLFRPCSLSPPPHTGWCPSVVSPVGDGAPAALDGGRPLLLLQAASQGNVTLLSMLLHQPHPSNPDHTHRTTAMDNQTTRHPPQDLLNNLTAALFAAAHRGHTECVKLLLSSGSPADVFGHNRFTPLHFAATHGHSGCVEALLAAGAAVDAAADGGQTALFLASGAGRKRCVHILLSAGADRSRMAMDGCTCLHAAVRSGHVDTLRLLLCHPGPRDSAVTLQPDGEPALPADLLNHANADGWTAAHMAAALGLKECLEVLCSHREQDIERKDKCNRTIHDVATDDCKELLENLNQYRILVRVQYSDGGGANGPMWSMVGDDDDDDDKWADKHQLVLCRVSVDRSMCWSQLSAAIDHAFTAHLLMLCGEDSERPPLGLTASSISSVQIGGSEWRLGQELPVSPWDLVRKPLCQVITVQLKGLSESCLDELALESLFPLPVLLNYVRLVEQYGSVIFHGLEDSCQEYIASLLARCIKSKQEAVGQACEIVKVDVQPSLTKERLLDTLVTSGFLVPASPACDHGRCVVLLLQGLEKAASLSGLLGDLCHSLDNRTSNGPLLLNAGPHSFCQRSFLIGSLSKPRLQGSELRLQQHFRWLRLRWDQEPLRGLLARRLRRKLLHQTGSAVWASDGVMEKAVLWVAQVWQQLNACLAHLGTHEALMGPGHFLACPVHTEDPHAIVRWLSRLWSSVVVPRVEMAIVSRVTARCSSSAPLPTGSVVLSAGQQAVLKAALSILVNKAVLRGCPLPRHEVAFRGGGTPLTTIGSFKGSFGGRKCRDKLRRSNTGPRKKASPASSWTGGSFRNGCVSTTDVSCITNGKIHREASGLSLFLDDETDLIRELQSLSSSKSEPDIRRTWASKDHDGRAAGAPPPAPEQDVAMDQSAQPSPLPQARVQSSQHRLGLRAKSQLPVPSRVAVGNNNNCSNGSRSNSKANNSSGSSSNKQPQEHIWVLQQHNDK
ncbi:cortactin-binding protein 2 isoform X2 [Syngnathoides biaculeatus]|uniref:cortactin-binding protein 2 isoform X2 n=1 Tax=Syngnathoides biaculeatus TaxID=300417 RepID=UPI002ADD56F8|nr:cortactin-binding protein 2 isoform X2 [Syngnathoides biaculeatus]